MIEFMVGRSYTTGHHLFVKALIFAAWGGAIVVAAFVSEWLAPLLGLPEKYRILPWIPIMVIVTLIFAYLENKFDATLDALAAYLHIREELETRESFREAAALSFLFVADVDNRWYPLSEVRKLPREERKQYLFQAAERVKQEHLP